MREPAPEYTWEERWADYLAMKRELDERIVSLIKSAPRPKLIPHHLFADSISAIFYDRGDLSRAISTAREKLKKAVADRLLGPDETGVLNDEENTLIAKINELHAQARGILRKRRHLRPISPARGETPRQTLQRTLAMMDQSRSLIESLDYYLTFPGAKRNQELATERYREVVARARALPNKKRSDSETARLIQKGAERDKSTLKRKHGRDIRMMSHRTMCRYLSKARKTGDL
jgi:hypothetical protein